ncbi:adhesin [Streptomyces sp. NPDC048604]|uniref:adhesin n=1 Tax=Streptomyces sp. NPDC048604 TaxID=3365578 RepID=UPI003715EEC5
MACERCGNGRRGPLPGMVCPDCARARPVRHGGTVLLIAGALTVAAAITVLALVGGEGGEGDEGDARQGAAAARPGGGLVRVIPTRIAPTEFPSEPATGLPADPTGSAAPTPPTSGPPTPPHAPTPPPSPDYDAWAGPGCAGGRGGEYREHGRYEDGREGWYTVPSGGHRGDGCDGRFTAIPMSGSATRDNGNTATWSWPVGAGYDSCTLAVQVPSPPDRQDAAGDPTVYEVLANGSAYARFEVDQPSHSGELLHTAWYPLHDDRFTVRLLDRGVDWGSQERDGAHHGAAQMRLSCR